MFKLKELEDTFFVNRDDPKIGNFKNLYVDLSNIYNLIPEDYQDKLDSEFNTIRQEFTNKHSLY